MSDIETITDFVYNKQRLTLKTSRLDEYLHWLIMQTWGDDRWLGKHSREQLKREVKRQARSKAGEFPVIPPEFSLDFKDIKKIIDVGSGVAQIDLILSQLFPQIDFYLVDKTGYEQDPENFVYYSKSLDDKNYHGFYNSFDIIQDIIDNSPINSDRIHFLYPENNWPKNVDVIMSYYSWNWHYPKNIYWNKLLKSLRIGGYLSTTLTLREGEDTIFKISEELGSYPCYYQPIAIHTNSRDKLIPGFEQIIHTGYYVWKRLK